MAALPPDMAPIQVPVALCDLPARPGRGRFYRLSWAIGRRGIAFGAPLPFDIGQSVALSWRLPHASDDTGPPELDEILGVIESGPRPFVRFRHLDPAWATLIEAYVDQRNTEITP